MVIIRLLGGRGRDVGYVAVSEAGEELGSNRNIRGRGLGRSLRRQPKPHLIGRLHHQK